MENKMHHNHLEEFFAAFIGFFAFYFKHSIGIQKLQVAVTPDSFDLTNKLINLLFGVLTACFAYLAVFLIKKYITKESK